MDLRHTTETSSSIECHERAAPSPRLSLRDPFTTALTRYEKRGPSILLRAHRRDRSHGVFVCCEPRSSVLQRAVAARKRNRQLVQRRMHLARGPGSSLPIPPPETQPLDPLPSPCVSLTYPRAPQRFRQADDSRASRQRGTRFLNKTSIRCTRGPSEASVIVTKSVINEESQIFRSGSSKAGPLQESPAPGR